MSSNAAAPAPGPSVTVDVPKPGARVPFSTTVSGKATGLTDGQRLWAVVLPANDNRFYPQAGPLLVGPNGSWIGPAYFGTSASPAGERFTLLIMSADASASREFQDYLREANQTKHYPGLELAPVGTAVLVSIPLVRS